MDYIKKFDLELDKDVIYAGEKLTGQVVVENIENIKVQGIRIFLRGKAHTEWKITRAGERRTVKEDEYYIDDKKVVWGKDKNEEGPVPILPRGVHRLPVVFQIPESAIPCSFESKIGRIRYYLRIILDIPYASPPQGLKYFTLIGPHIDCMDERYLTPCHFEDKKRVCCLCCAKGPVTVQTTLARSAYCCGENIKLKAEVQNGSDQSVWLIFRLMQYVEYFINKGVLGLTKELSHKVWEYQGETVSPHTTVDFDDLQEHLQVPVMPPTLLDVCSLINIYYVLKVSLGMEKSGEDLEIDHPITVATVPFRIPNSPSPELHYECAADNVEGGIYISPEFQFGQVYMGDNNDDVDETVLYRPVYVCVPHDKINVSNTNNAGKAGSERGNGDRSHQSDSNGDSDYPRRGQELRAAEPDDAEDVEPEKQRLLQPLMTGSSVQPEDMAIEEVVSEDEDVEKPASSSMTKTKTVVVDSPDSSSVVTTKSVRNTADSHSDSSFVVDKSTSITDANVKVEQCKVECKLQSSQRVETVIEETVERCRKVSPADDIATAAEHVDTIVEEHVQTFSTTVVERISEKQLSSANEEFKQTVVSRSIETSEPNASSTKTTSV
ncbi:LOW QUALITY PROTEIN: arrestin domain-containing protein 3-like [Liolophura sinensis]|uniref:LOW QUALITY PROTEIN: arrestin domain-containing protein 3-like n=1 Tax=Liolophura sinensis TaxID=3198878 RepID=UPI003158978B